MKLVIATMAACTLLMFAALALSVHADPRTVEQVDAAAFTALQAGQLAAGKLYYSETVVPFADWSAQFPDEAASLVLFPGYVEPTVKVKKNGVEKTSVEKLVVFIGRTKTILNKAPGQIDLKKLIDIATVTGFDNEIQHYEIKPEQLMANVVANHKPIDNFKWCNTEGAEANIARPLREIDLSSTVSAKRPWCPADGRTLCVESCYLFGVYWQQLVAGANLAIDAAEKKDYGIASQSEIKYFTSEQELGLPVKLTRLTGIKTGIHGGLEQSVFYFNQVMQYGKVISVLQDSPANPNQTIMTTYFVIGLKQRTYNQFAEIRDIFMGRSSLFNTATGITAGLPVYSQNTIKAMATELEK